MSDFFHHPTMFLKAICLIATIAAVGFGLRGDIDLVETFLIFVGLIVIGLGVAGSWPH